MATITCPHCQFTGNAPTNLLGQTMRCPTCRNAFVPPARSGSGPAGTNFNFNPAVSPIINSPGFGSSGDSEPWFYPWCYRLACTLMVIDIIGLCLGFVGWLLFGLYVAAKSYSFFETLVDYFVASFFVVLQRGIALLLLLFVFTGVLILIDVARHHRRLCVSVRSYLKT